MLRKEQNDLLTQTGPGTSMGQLFRSYWIPALQDEELPANDCPLHGPLLATLGFPGLPSSMPLSA